MKVILLEDVRKIGKKGEVVNVSDGHGYNFLIPNKKAVLATKKSLEIKKDEEKEKKEEEEKKKEQAKKLKKELEDKFVKIKVKVGADNKMFGSVSSKNIVEEFEKQFKIKLDKRKFLKAHSINKLGYSKIEIELYKGIIGTLNVQVIEEK